MAKPVINYKGYVTENPADRTGGVPNPRSSSVRGRPKGRPHSKIRGKRVRKFNCYLCHESNVLGGVIML